MMIILILTSVLSLLSIATMVGGRILAIRSGRIAVIEQPTFFSIIQTRIDWLAVIFVLVCREGLKFVFLHAMMSLKKAASYLKVWAIKVEKRFAKVIDLVHGKGATSKKGAVSFFLREIKDHQDRNPLGIKN